MLCTKCGCQASRVVSTRKLEDAMMTRRRECLNCEHRFTTKELNESVLRGIGWKAINDMIVTSIRGVEQRKATAELRKKVKEKIIAGWKPTAIGHHLDISEARVRQIRAELQEMS